MRHDGSAELRQLLTPLSKAGCQEKTRQAALGTEPGLSITEVFQGTNIAKYSVVDKCLTCSVCCKVVLT